MNIQLNQAVRRINTNEVGQVVEFFGNMPNQKVLVRFVNGWVAVSSTQFTDEESEPGRWYDPGMVNTIKNIRDDFKCSLLAAKRVFDWYRSSYVYNSSYWWLVSAEHFDAWVGTTAKYIIDYIDGERASFNRLYDAIDEHNSKFGTNYHLVG